MQTSWGRVVVMVLSGFFVKEAVRRARDGSAAGMSCGLPTHSVGAIGARMRAVTSGRSKEAHIGR